jgi:ubiquinone/menaquinone biosynthesis C-methylase UbiE
VNQLHSRRYVPAAGHDWALPLYDPLLKLFRLDAQRAHLLAGVDLRAGQRALDLGCGTGSLICELKRRQPALELTGIDPDPKALAAARKKVERSGHSVRLEQAFADALPCAPGSFDHVFSSFMFHHLEAAEKRATLAEVLRVLAPGGLFHLLDFRDEPAQKSPIMRLLHSFNLETALAGQRESEVEALIGAAGFANVALETRRLSVFGAVAICHARAPTGDRATPA